MFEFARVQAGKFGMWLLRCFLIAYVLTWLVGSVAELLRSGEALSLLWLLEMAIYKP